MRLLSDEQARVVILTAGKLSLRRAAVLLNVDVKTVKKIRDGHAYKDVYAECWSSKHKRPRKQRHRDVKTA